MLCKTSEDSDWAVGGVFIYQEDKDKQCYWWASTSKVWQPFFNILGEPSTDPFYSTPSSPLEFLLVTGIVFHPPG
jgi:hypothetical protein